MNIELAEEYQNKTFENYFQNQRPEMLSYIPQNVSKILDIGCSDGSFSWQLKSEQNIEVWGVEPNRRAAEIAAKRLDKVICDVFSENLDLPEKHFDCIIFNDVLEHFVDHCGALTYAKNLLRDKGVVVASIPNVRYFDNIWNLVVHKNWEYQDWGILDSTHLRFFTCRSIESTFRKLGYQITQIQGINPLEKVHPYQSRKFEILNWLLLKKIEDMRFLQFAVVASPCEQS